MQLRMAFIGVPVSGTLIALWAMRNYELDETAVSEVKQSLSERQSTSSKVSPAESAAPGTLALQG
jgi:GPH family glycoside/pentoside/hexuronide:cation symporter